MHNDVGRRRQQKLAYHNVHSHVNFLLIRHNVSRSVCGGDRLCG